MFKQLLSVNDFRKSLASYSENNTHKYTGKSIVSIKKVIKTLFKKQSNVWGGSKIHPLPLTTPPLFSMVMMLSKSSVLMGVMQKFHKQSKENR